VANAETGEMEWHAADGTVVTQEQWNAQAAAELAAAEGAPVEAIAEATAATPPAEAAAVEPAVEASTAGTQTQGDGDNAAE